MSIQCRLTLVNAHSYDDMLGVCCSVLKIPSQTLVILLFTYIVYYTLTYLLSVLVTVALLIVGFY